MNTRHSLFLLFLGIFLGLPGIPTGTGAQDLSSEVLPEPPEPDDAIFVSPARQAMYEGMMNAQAERFDDAIPKLEYAIQEDPTLVGAWQTLGWVYWLTDRVDEAEALWSRLITIAPNEPMGYNLMAQVAMRDGDFTKGRELYETSLRLNPDQTEIRYNYAKVLLWEGESRQAAELLRQLLDEDPERLDIEIDLAWARYVNEEYEKAFTHWNRINEEIPDNPGFLLARANVLLLLGAWDEAEADARRALEIEPRNEAVLNLLVSLAIRTQRPEDAVEILRRVKQMVEDDRDKAHIALRISAYMKEVYDTGSTLFSRTDILRATRESLDLNPDQVGAHLFYGEILVLDRQYGRAEEVFTHILDAFNPNSIRALGGLVETYFGRSMYEDAEQKLRENERRFNPNNPYRHTVWARLHFARGNFQDALDALDRLEHEGSQGSVFTLLYHGINPSEFSDMPSVRLLREHLMILKRNGYRFIVPSELEAYFEQKTAAALTDDRPWLYRRLQSVRRSLTGEETDRPLTLPDYTPDKVVMVTFDDGLRNSFRHGTDVAEEMDIRMAMFIGVGDVLNPAQRYVASFPEIRQFYQTGRWEIHSHNWDAGILTLVDPEAERMALPIPNLAWLPEQDRRETLREHQARLRKEFRGSRETLIRELGLNENDVFAVAYPYGEVGQENETNIRHFNVPEIVLNEADIVYDKGFIQYRHGYALKTDDHLLYKRWEPDRNATGRDVLRSAYRQHPVFMARRMRAEMAALNGQLYMALDNIDRLKRDGYPEEDLAELNEYVRRRLARLAPLPEGVDDITGEDGAGEPLLSLRKPYIGVDGILTRANEMIDDREVSVFAGLNLNPRLNLQVRVGEGRIKQTVATTRLEDVVVTPATETEPAVRRGTMITEIERFRADKTFVGVSLNYTHRDGAFTLAEARRYRIKGRRGGDIEDENADTFRLEHQWRPVLALDLAAWYQYGLTPSAREIISYDNLGLRAFWRIRDYWQSSGLVNFSFFEDRNSLLNAQAENFWRVSQPYDIWIGLSHSLETMDRDSDLYYSPYWDQRHFGVLRIRRSYPNYYGMFRVNLGVRKSDVRREELERYENARARGEAEGWSPGPSPKQGWQKQLGANASLTRTFESGFEITGAFSVNASGDYTEHTASLRLMYTF